MRQKARLKPFLCLFVRLGNAADHGYAARPPRARRRDTPMDRNGRGAGTLSGLRLLRARTRLCAADRPRRDRTDRGRSEEHTSELQSLMRISYAVFCLKKKKKT